MDTHCTPSNDRAADARAGVSRRLAQVAGLLGGLFVVMAVNDDNGCAPAEIPNRGGQAECSAASECSGDPGVDCVGQWACVSGSCAFQCGVTPDGCYGDQDCKDGQVCNAAEVCHRPPGCSADGTCPAVCYGECVDAPPPPAKCTSSAQCAEDQHCSTEDGDCQSNCAPGMACPAVCWGDCVPDRVDPNCYSDADCAFGQTCDMDPCVFPGDAAGADRLIACGGVCKEREGCSADSDCATGEVCGCAPYPGVPNGMIACYLQCLPASNACNYDGDCAAGQVCQNGQCTEPQRECGSAADCPSGWTCEQSCGWDASGDANGTDPAGRPWCPSYCAPPTTEACGDTGEVCANGQHCETSCYTMCADCDCAEGEACACPCFEECKSACVDDQPTQCTTDSECPAGTHCGCAGWDGAPIPNGLVWCPMQCIPNEGGDTCFSDSDCKDGFACNFANCGANDCDPSGQSCGDRAAFACQGTCEAVTPPFDCTTDADCINAAGVTGTCEFAVCTAETPCDGNSDQCRPFMPPMSCAGYCRYDAPVVCDPTTGETCPAGTHCEANGCGGASDADPSFRPCLVQYQCVPDQVACATDCDCDPSLACNNGVCQRMGRINTCGLNGCQNDTQCAPNDYCHIDAWDVICLDCPDCPCTEVPKGHCEPRPNAGQCQSDSDCGAGQYCGCGQDPSCPMCDVCFFQCMPRQGGGECKEDADCGRGNVCTMYYPPCAAPPADMPMPPDYCQPIGVCEPAPIPDGRCLADADCSTGEKCQPAVCPAIACAPGQYCPPCYGTCAPVEEPGSCVRTGCSGQVCADTDVATTCEWAPWYQCYRAAICGRSSAGTCEWQRTDEFVRCMTENGGFGQTP